MIDFSNLDIDKTKRKISISNLLDTLFTPFDSEGVAQNTYNKHFNNPESEYYHMTVEQILEAWSAKGARSTHYGSLLDDYIGCILTGNENDLRLFKLDNGYDYDEKLKAHCDAFDNFYSILSKSGDTKFIDREKYLYLDVKNPITGEDMYVYGRFDALFKNERINKYILIDWKSSGTIDKTPTKWTKKMLGPMFKYPQLNWYRYTLQLYFYKEALLKTGYVPADTKPEDIIVMIVNLPDHVIPEVNMNYQIHQGAMPYDENMMDTFYKFAIEKFILLEEQKKNEKQEEEKEAINEEKNITDKNLENIF